MALALDFNKTRRTAAKRLARGRSLEQVARLGHLPIATLRIWLEHDQDFQHLVLLARVHAFKRSCRRVITTLEAIEARSASAIQTVDGSPAGSP